MITTLRSERGTTLVETMIAVGILFTALVGLLSMATYATTYTENHGHLEARTTEYAQDKMEQLLAISYGDQSSDTVTFPATLGTGSGLGPSTIAVGATVGTADHSATPVDDYVDWLSAEGALLGGGVTAPETWFYKRVWQVTCVSATGGTCTSSPAVGLKQIKVTSTVRASVGRALIPVSTVVALKTAQF